MSVGLPKKLRVQKKFLQVNGNIWLIFMCHFRTILGTQAISLVSGTKHLKTLMDLLI